ncbi:BON domain-containing protein [Legionella israelensis]|uniref:BON domain-containing protein n=1 Tax=Legionella israelensis TaxID=454 RepID=A0AAX1EHF4_9GAMM|nr:BON domain-containing protein [Legionella israelensis]QBR84568.1 BON domain-containing protein [Legionella israelensis]
MKKYLIIPFIAFLFSLLSACNTGTQMDDFLGVRPSDAILTSNVQKALYLNDDPVIANLHAESIDGTVVLTGYVKKIHQSDEAEAIARGTRGVKSVKNNIIVRQ